MAGVRAVDSSWTDERVAKLKDLWAKGLSCAQVAAELGGFETCAGGGRSAVIGKIHRLKLPQPVGKRVSTRNTTERARSNLSAAPSGRRPTRNTTRLQSIVTEKRNPSNSLAEKLKIAESDPGLSAGLAGEEPDGTGVKLIDLTPGLCKWPKGDPLLDSFEFCGCRALPDLPYCAPHTRKSMVPTQSRTRADRALANIQA